MFRKAMEKVYDSQDRGYVSHSAERYYAFSRSREARKIASQQFNDNGLDFHIKCRTNREPSIWPEAWLLKHLQLKQQNFMGGSPGELSEELVTQEKRKKGWRMNCDVGEVTEILENELCYISLYLYINSVAITLRE